MTCGLRVVGRDVYLVGPEPFLYSLQGKEKHIGYYSDLDAAARAYDIEAFRVHGAKAHLNAHLNNASLPGGNRDGNADAAPAILARANGDRVRFCISFDLN
jgi:hypothetical protein